MRFAAGRKSSMAGGDELEVTVAWVRSTSCDTVALSVPRGTTLEQVVRRSGFLGGEAETEELLLGVDGERREPGELVESGMRIELLRPLLDDPKVIRRRRARER